MQLQGHHSRPTEWKFREVGPPSVFVTNLFCGSHELSNLRYLPAVEDMWYPVSKCSYFIGVSDHFKQLGKH